MDKLSNGSSDDLQALIESARSGLTAAQDTPSIRRDPYRLVLAALSDILPIFGRSVTRWEGAVADVIAARHPFPEDEIEVLQTRIIAAVEKGAYQGMRAEGARVVRMIDTRLSVKIGACLGGAFILGAVSVVVFLAVTSLGPFSPGAKQKEAWASLMQQNPDPRPAIAVAQVKTDQAGRRYAMMPLWLDPPRSPPSQ